MMTRAKLHASSTSFHGKNVRPEIVSYVNPVTVFHSTQSILEVVVFDFQKSTVSSRYRFSFFVHVKIKTCHFQVIIYILCSWKK